MGQVIDNFLDLIRRKIDRRHQPKAIFDNIPYPPVGIVFPVFYHPPTGGLLLGGGGFFMPIRKISPVALRFQPTFWFSGCSILIAPGTGHCSTQLPQNQHSSGYRINGGFSFSGFGMNISVWQASTQELHPVHSPASNLTG
jgi:hypothetical protein